MGGGVREGWQHPPKKKLKPLTLILFMGEQRLDFGSSLRVHAGASREEAA